MKKFIIILSIIFCGSITADVLPYKPKPIIWVHGLGSNSETWGAGVYKEQPDSLHPDSIVPGFTYAHFLNDFMLPIVWRWYNYEKDQGLPITYTPDPILTPAYPNKTFLEVINFEMRHLDSNGFEQIQTDFFDKKMEGQ